MNYYSIFNEKNDLEIYCFNNKKVFITSFFNSKTISKDIAEYQKKVFNKFNILLNQFDDDIRHPEFMDYIMNNINADIFIFFDIDCILLRKNIINEILLEVNDNSIFGLAQCDNSNDLNHIYAAPSCFGITKNLYNNLSNPSFVERQRYISNYNNKIENTKNLISAYGIKDIGYGSEFYNQSMKIAQRLNLKLICDTAEEITYLCEEKGYNINLWYPTNYDKNSNTWRLGNSNILFGNGTIYNNCIYHNFQIRKNEESQRFINKCKEILNNLN